MFELFNEKFPFEVAVPISVLVSITVASIVVAQDWEKIHLRSVGWLMIFILIGLPLGLLLLIEGDEHIVKAGLGIIIIVFSIYSLLDRYQIRLSSDNKLLLFICGLFAGIFWGVWSKSIFLVLYFCTINILNYAYISLIISVIQL